MAKVLLVGSIAGSLANFRGDLIKEWVSRGLEVTTLSRPTKETRREKILALGAKHREIPIKRDKLSPLQDLKLILELRRIFGQEKPEYIFAYTVKPVLYSGLCLPAAGQARFFVMITGLGYAFVGFTLKQRLLKKVLSLLYRNALKKSEAVFFQNGDDLAIFREMGLVGANQKVVMINGSGVNLEYFSYSKPPADKEISFLLIGRLLTSKGIREYARAAEMVKSRCPGAKFILLGRLLNSPDSINLTELKRWQDEGVLEYEGGTEDVRPYLEQCSVYTLPSYREGTPRSVLEAMSTGRAIITTDAPGCRETVIEGVNGFLVPVQDCDALAGAMFKFIEQPELIEKMGTASRKLAEEKFDVNKVNRVILEAMGLGEVRDQSREN